MKSCAKWQNFGSGLFRLGLSVSGERVWKEVLYVVCIADNDRQGKLPGGRPGTGREEPSGWKAGKFMGEMF